MAEAGIIDTTSNLGVHIDNPAGEAADTTGAIFRNNFLGVVASDEANSALAVKGAIVCQREYNLVLFSFRN